MMSWRGKAALVALAVAVAGCGTAHSAPGVAAASTRSPAHVEVSARVARSVPCLDPERQPAGVPVPARFVVVAAIRCIQSDQVVPGHGLWRFDLWQVAEHGLTRLAEVLRRPSATPPPGLACAEPGISVPPFMLLGGNGRMIYPKLPAEECGNPQRQVLDAVQALHWMTVSTRRGQQVETQAGIESGCPAGWKDVISLEESFSHGRSPHPSPGGRAFSPRPSWLRVCVYHDRSGPLDTFLIGGSRISGAAETALLAGIAAGRRSATCPQPHTMFAVLLPPQTGSLPAYVEIGGCQRVLRPDNRIGQASPAALMIINQARHS